MKLLKTMLITTAAMAALAMIPSGAQAHSYDTDDDGHPIRWLSYPIHAIGKGVEYSVSRPVHWGVSQCKSRYIFGHVSHPKTDDYWGDWNLYQRYSY